MSKLKTEKKEKHAGGRPTKYDPSVLPWIEKLCKLGATDVELAEFLEVNPDTIHEWKKKYPEFSESIKKGKLYADANVADRLYQRAIGFEHDSEEIKVVSKPGKHAGSQIERVKIRKIYAPDTTAAIFFLKNRRPADWRDKHEVEFKETAPIVGMIIEGEPKKKK
jgi:hypothetical protein